MKVSPAKENILKRVRNALSQPVQLPFPRAEGNASVYNTPEGEEPEIAFAEAFSRLQGKFVFCADHEELAANLSALAANKDWKKVHCQELQLVHILSPYSLSFINTGEDMDDIDAGITTCEALVARTGSIIMSAAQPSGRSVGIFAPVHIVVAYASQLVPDIKEGLQYLKEKYGPELPSMISFQTGPSRTADIEKTLVVGVHGPREVYVFLVDQ
ncbi:LutC/YkgG family protein [Compostibacter hankyongensis]|uniref:LUD domain-containing protein n=1 Tax=Compostibacter hankyongensis TaxID=1007089 RepID=A0ABP8FST7_9BACT